MAVPKDVTESSLLVGPEPPPSQRQKRAPLTPVQLLARRGYLTPKDVMYTPEQMGASQSARPSSAAATPSPRAARASYTAATPPPKQRPASTSLP